MKKGVFLLAFAFTGCVAARENDSRPAVQSLADLDKNLDPFATAFDAAHGRFRFVAILSPT